MMDQTMKKLLSTTIISLLFISFQSFASRPAEDDPIGEIETIPEESSSNIPSPAEMMDNEPTEAPQADLTNDTMQQQTGDVIQISETPSGAHVVIIDFPIRGMDMSKVLNELGEPMQRFPAIGKPPITRWVYADRTVFFEYSHVIHVVAK